MKDLQIYSENGITWVKAMSEKAKKAMIGFKVEPDKKDTYAFDPLKGYTCDSAAGIFEAIHNLTSEIITTQS